jgi:hypothetical protein
LFRPYAINVIRRDGRRRRRRTTTMPCFVNLGYFLGETKVYYWLFVLLEISASQGRTPNPKTPSSNLTGCNDAILCEY